jgi:hypothetical protein
MDRPIQKFQTRLYAAIKNEFCFGDDDYQSYGRVYRNQTKDGYIPEAYNTKGEYKEVLFDDTNKLQSFFGVGERSEVEGSQHVIPVHLVFHADLCKIYETLGIPHRPDEELRTTITNIIRKTLGFGLSYISLETGVENVFREYSGTRIEKGMKYRDMHPMHCFRFNMELRHSPEEDDC